MKTSILVPFRHEKGTSRLRNWRWLRKRWETLFPDFEICVGTDTEEPFSKSVAVNDAYRKASGDCFVIADADSWCEPQHIHRAINDASTRGRLVVPWTNAYRLNEQDSLEILKMDPSTTDPVTQAMRRDAEEYKPSPSTAAMVIVIMRDDFERIGGFDPRFRGWGAEDVSVRLAADTLVRKTRYMLSESFALYHERTRIADGRRVWNKDNGNHNAPLGQLYWDALGKIHAMTALCMAHPLAGAKTLVGAGPHALDDPPDTFVKELQKVDGTSTTGGVYRLWGGTKDGERIAL